MKTSEIRKIVDTAMRAHKAFDCGSAYYVSAESALEQAIAESTGEFKSVGCIVGRATIESMMAAAKSVLIKPVGRPADVSGKKVNTYLDAESIAIATRLGNGNVSEGIRKALAIASQSM